MFNGSSPLTRGALRFRPRAPLLLGLIPAHAGSTNVAAAHQGADWAHPRSRGEHLRGLRLLLRLRGSSPLTRGALLNREERSRAGRLIPAHAGSTLVRLRMTLVPRAHPRSRGEHVDGLTLADEVLGSSPLTRGARCGCGCGAYSPGLIPAHAGSTRTLSMKWVGLRAHPRSRGEHRPYHVLSNGQKGSSPLTRGARGLHRVQDHQQRLIPAHAGSTLSSGPRNSSFRAHPRSRGEHQPARTQQNTSLGSSPLTRGALAIGGRTDLQIGLIPAHAGSTSL